MGWRGTEIAESADTWLEKWLRGYAEVALKQDITNGSGVLSTTKSTPDRKVTILTKEIAHELVKGQGSDIVIPDVYTSIADSAFESEGFSSGGVRKRFPDLTSVIIPKSITNIGERAFALNSLTSVVIPDSVTKFSGEQQFRDNKLTDVTLSKNLKEISAGAFEGNQLRSIEIPDGVTLIDDSAFAENQLQSIEIPNSVTYITNAAFLDNQLTSVKIPDSVTLIGNIAFKGNNLNTVEIPEGTMLLGGSQFDPGVQITYRERKTTPSGEANENQDKNQILEIDKPNKFNKNQQTKSSTSTHQPIPWKSIPTALASIVLLPLLLAKTKRQSKRSLPSKTSTSSMTKRKAGSISMRMVLKKALVMAVSLPSLEVLLS